MACIVFTAHNNEVAIGQNSGSKVKRVIPGGESADCMPGPVNVATSTAGDEPVPDTRGGATGVERQNGAIREQLDMPYASRRNVSDLGPGSSGEWCLCAGNHRPATESEQRDSQRSDYKFHILTLHF